MTLLGIIAVIAASGWIVLATFRRFRSRRYSLVWRVITVLLSAAGLALGIWLVTREYLVSPTERMAGYPFPVGGYEFIGGRWLGGLVSQFVLLALAADVLAGLALCLLPLRLAQLIVERRLPHASP